MRDCAAAQGSSPGSLPCQTPQGRSSALVLEAQIGPRRGKRAERRTWQGSLWQSPSAPPSQCTGKLGGLLLGGPQALAMEVALP